LAPAAFAWMKVPTISASVAQSSSVPSHMMACTAFHTRHNSTHAPQVAQVLNKGFSALPDRCWISIIFMVILGVTLPLLGVYLRRSRRFSHLARCVALEAAFEARIILTCRSLQIRAQRCKHRTFLYYFPVSGAPNRAFNA
jgi:hypothetical protein